MLASSLRSLILSEKSWQRSAPILFLEGFWPSDDEEEEENPVVPRPRRIRRKDDPFFVCNDFEFKRRY